MDNNAAPHAGTADEIREAYERTKAELGIETPPAGAPPSDEPPRQPASHTDLKKLLDAIEHPTDPAPAAASPELVMRAPELTSGAIAQVFEQAAKHVEDVAEALMQQAIDAIAQARETAAGLRAKGAAEASKIEGVAKAARETVHLFKAQHAKVIGSGIGVQS